jgi:hypothetical protein
MALRLVRLVAILLGVALVCGCNQGLQENFAAQQTEFGGSSYEVPVTESGTPLEKLRTEYDVDGNVVAEERTPISLPRLDPTRTRGPQDRTLTVAGPEFWQILGDGNNYMADIGQQYAYASSPQDVVEIFLGRAEEVVTGNPSIRGSFTGNIEVFDEDQDGVPERIKASKSEVVLALADLTKAYEGARKALIEGVVLTENQRFESIEAVELARTQAIRDITVEFFAAARALASGGASEIIPDGN